MVSGNLTCSLSDHLPQFLVVPNESCSVPSNHNIYIRNMRRFNKESFLADIQTINWDQTLDVDRGDLDYSFDNFLSQFNKILDTHAPLKKATKKDLKLQQKPWITKGILCSIRKRDIIFRQFKKCKQQLRRNNLHNRYKFYRNQIVSLTRLSKKNHLQNYFESNIKNSRKIWQGIREIINLNKNYNFVPNYIVSGTNSYSDPKSIANCFNDFFTSIGNKIQKSVYSNHVNFSNYLTNPSVNSFFANPTTPVEIIDLISSFKKNKATGPNSIPNKILHLVSDKISYPISNLINLSFGMGKFPTSIKQAKITPVHKKGSRLNVDNYRPISLLSNINKIFEKLMYKRIYNFLSVQQSFFEMQFGFREKHSTFHALASLTELVRESLDKNKFVCGIFIDLKKAFDTVDHKILLKKLEYYGIRGLSNDWFRSYLTDRKQFVSINGYDSDMLGVNIGVPQGSVLGPLLFLIYINDFHLAIKNSTVHHFADDTNLLHANDSMKQLNKLLNQDLRSLCDWLKANKIALNVAKTEVLFFRHPNKAFNNDLKLKIDGKKLFPSHNVKYLGVYVDEFLSFKHHTYELARKLRRANGMLSKIRHYLPLGILRSVYFSIFESHLTYCCCVWGQKGNSLSDKIISLQNSAMRLLTFSDFRAPSKPMYQYLNILTFRCQVQLQNVIFVNSVLNGVVPRPLTNFFSLRGDAHNHVPCSIA